MKIGLADVTKYKNPHEIKHSLVNPKNLAFNKAHETRIQLFGAFLYSALWGNISALSYRCSDPESQTPHSFLGEMSVVKHFFLNIHLSYSLHLIVGCHCLMSCLAEV